MLTAHLGLERVNDAPGAPCRRRYTLTAPSEALPVVRQVARAAEGLAAAARDIHAAWMGELAKPEVDGDGRLHLQLFEPRRLLQVCCPPLTAPWQ